MQVKVKSPTYLVFPRMTIFLRLLPFFVVAASTDSPTSVEWNLIFPRENETYRRVEYFPVVFAIQNASVALSYGALLSWQLEEEFPSPDVKDSALYRPDISSPPETGPLYITNITTALNSSSASRYRLRWQFGITSNCTDNRQTGDSSILFNISDTIDTPIPNIISQGTCPRKIGVIVVNESTSAISQGRNCADLSPVSEIGLGESCSLQVDQRVADEFTASVSATVARSTCSATGTYPLITRVCNTGTRENQRSLVWTAIYPILLFIVTEYIC
jgi:hypothetical protein